jgi:hypothetical protein
MVVAGGSKQFAVATQYSLQMRRTLSIKSAKILDNNTFTANTKTPATV